jgi:anti-anti-sigma regulatory factor
MRRATRGVAEPGGGSASETSALTAPSRTLEEVVLEYPAGIKVHDPCRAGVLVELSGEFDVSCLVAFGHALRRASGLGRRTFVDLSGVTFMDALCLRELASRLDAGARPLELCRPSWQFRRGVAACGLEGNLDIRPDDDPDYGALIAEVCACERAGRTAQPEAHHLHVSPAPERAIGRPAHTTDRGKRRPVTGSLTNLNLRFILP